MKEIVIILFLVATHQYAGAQISATQSLDIEVTNAIEITFTGTQNTQGGNVNLVFDNVDDYANGIVSEAQGLKITSNTAFALAVKAGAESFTYSGVQTPSPAMPVDGVLSIKVNSNGTGGTVASPFSTSSYYSLNNTDRNLLSAATKGIDKAISVVYKATPGFAYPGGTYSVDVIYTATQE